VDHPVGIGSPAPLGEDANLDRTRGATFGRWIEPTAWWCSRVTVQLEFRSLNRRSCWRGTEMCRRSFHGAALLRGTSTPRKQNARASAAFRNRPAFFKAAILSGPDGVENSLECFVGFFAQIAIRFWRASGHVPSLRVAPSYYNMRQWVSLTQRLGCLPVSGGPRGRRAARRRRSSRRNTRRNRSLSRQAGLT
jgi:hypothetical protein